MKLTRGRRSFLSRSLAGAALAGGLAGCAQRAGLQPQSLDPALAPADLAWLNRLSFAATTRSAAHLARVGRDTYLDEQLALRALAPLPAAVQAQIDALSISQSSLEQRVSVGEQQRRAADALVNDEEKKAAQQAYQQGLSLQAREASARYLLRAVYGETQLLEQMTWFWFNHFNVHQYKHNLRLMVGDYESALRRHALGRFRDLLGAAALHPAMLRYLDNEQNAAKRINENFARELLELHTLGVDGGYAQADVQELARVLTGLGVNLGGEAPRVPPKLQPLVVSRGLMLFNPQRHDMADKRVLGRLLRGQGLPEVEQVLDGLARHPATARHVSRRLATFWVSDDPPRALVDRLARRYLATDGRIDELLHTLFAAPEFEASLGRKFKDPLHYVVSAVRLAYEDKPILNAQPMVSWLYRMGQGLYNRQTPDGYPMDAAGWASPGQMNTRFEIARLLGSGSAGLFKTEGPRGTERPAFPRLANALYDRSWAPTLGAATRAALDEAQSPQEWNAFFLSSPEFMFR